MTNAEKFPSRAHARRKKHRSARRGLFERAAARAGLAGQLPIQLRQTFVIFDKRPAALASKLAIGKEEAHVHAADQAGDGCPLPGGAVHTGHCHQRRAQTARE